MALKKQKIDLQLGKFSLNTNLNPQSTELGSLPSCKNAIFPREGLIAKKEGYEAKTLGEYPSEIMYHPWRDRIHFISGSLFYWDNENNESVAYSGGCRVVDVEKSNIRLGRSDLHYYCDVAKCGDIIAVTYTGYDGTDYSTHIETFRSDTGIPISSYDVDTSCSTPRPGKFATDGSTFLHWFYINDSNALQYVTVNVTTGAIGTASNVTSAPAAHTTNYSFDVCVSGSSIIIVYPKSDLSAVEVNRVTADTPGTCAHNVEIDGGSTTPEIHRVACCAIPAGYPLLTSTVVEVAWIEEETNGGDTLYVFAGRRYSADLTSRCAITQVAEIGSDATYNAVSIVNCNKLYPKSGVDPCSVIYWCFETDSTSIPQVDFGTYSDDGDGTATVADNGLYFQRARIATKPHKFNWHTTESVIIGLYTESWDLATTPMTQRHLVWADYEKNVIGKSLAGVFAADGSYGVIPNLQHLSDYYSDEGDAWLTSVEFLTCGMSLSQVENAYDITNLYTLSYLELSIGRAVRPNPTDNGKYLFIPGSLSFECDGAIVVEQGFVQYPEPFGLTDTNSGDGSVDTGDYEYICVYEWIDSYGNIHQSPASQIGSVTVSNDSVTVVVPSLPFTNKENVVCAIYRTEEGPGSVFYRVAAVANNKAASTMTYVDKKADSSINTNKTLYTGSGELSNTQPPPTRTCAVYKDRLFYVDRNSEDTLYYTKGFVSGEGTGYNSYELFIKVSGDSVTALAEVASYLVIFTEGRIYVTGGDGYDNTGSGQNFDTPSVISNGAGCSNRNSIVQTSIGVMFQSSDNNIYLIGNDLSMSRIGDPVLYHLENHDVECAWFNRSTGIAVFGVAGDSLVFDCETGKWSVWEISSVYDGGEAYSGLNFWGNSSGSMYGEVAGTYDRDGSDCSLEIDTGWIAPSELGGFQRLYQVLLAGYNHVGSNNERTLHVDVMYNFDPSVAEEKEFVLEETGSINGNTRTVTYDYEVHLDGDTYTEANYKDSAMLLKFKPARQKFKAIRFRIYDTAEDGQDIDADGFALTGISLIVGVKKPISFQPGEHRSE